MKIGIFTPTYPGYHGDGGIGAYTRSLCQGMRALGHASHVITPIRPDSSSYAPITDDEGKDDEGKGDGYGEGAAGITIHPTNSRYIKIVDRLSPGLGGSLRVGQTLRNVVNRHGLDVVELPNYDGMGLSYLLRRPRPLVVRLHTTSMLTVRGPMNRAQQWDHWRENYLTHHGDQLVTHSHAHRDTSAKMFGIDPDRIAVIPHGIAVSPRGIAVSPHGIAVTEDADTPAALTRIADESRPLPLRVVFLGRLEPQKGVLDLLHAIPKVLENVENPAQNPSYRVTNGTTVEFFLIGLDKPDAPGRRTHAAYVADEFPAFARSRIHFLGRLSDADVAKELAKADLFVAPSLYESFGLVFLEAMRFGLPIVGTNTGGIPEIVLDGQTGLLAPPQNPLALADAITRMLTNPDLRRKLGQAGRQRLRNHYTIAHMTQNVIQLYSEVIDRWRAKSHRYGIPS